MKLFNHDSTNVEKKIKIISLHRSSEMVHTITKQKEIKWRAHSSLQNSKT